MRRYLAILSTCLVMLFAIVWAWVAMVPLAYLDPEYPAWLAKRQMLDRCDLGELVVVGDSRAAVDVIPAVLPVRAANLAVGGGSPIEAYVGLVQAVECPDPPRRVVVSFDAAHFALPDLFWERSVRFGFVGREQLSDLRLVSHQLDDPTIYELRRGELPADLRGRLYSLRFPPLYFSSLVRGGVFLRWSRNRQALAATHATRGQYFFGTEHGSSQIAAEGHPQGFAPLPVLDHYFDRMLALLESRGIVVDFVAMPMNDATWRVTRQEVRDGFAAYLASYAARYGNFRVIGDAMPHWPNRWFGDGFSHLNPEGARRFSAELAVWLSATAGRATEHAEQGAVGMVE